MGNGIVKTKLERITEKLEYIESQISEMEMSIEELKITALSTRSVNYDRISGRTTRRTDTSDVLERIEQRICLYNDKINKLLNYKSVCERWFDTAGDELVSLVLKMRYIHHMRIVDVAEDLAYSDTQIKRFTRKAYELLDPEVFDMMMQEFEDE